MKYLAAILNIIIIFSANNLTLPDAIAEESTGVSQQLVPSTGPIENRQPVITRNPFVNASHGRIGKTLPGAGADKSRGSTSQDNEDAPLKSLRLRGVLISNDKAVALLDHKILRTGDMVGNYTVTEIADKWVTFSKGDIIVRYSIE